MTTAAQLIESAARTSRLVPEEQPVPPYISSRGLEIFNDILAEFGGNSVDIPVISMIDFDTIVGQIEYISGPGQYISGNQVMEIFNMHATQQQVRYGMLPFTEKMYNNVPFPQNEGVPSYYLLRKFDTTSTIIIQPNPTAVYTITMRCKQRLSEVDFNTNLTEVPAHWRRGLKFLIAKDFVTYFDLPVDPSFLQECMDVKKNLEAANTVDVFVEKTQILTNYPYCFPVWYGVVNV